MARKGKPSRTAQSQMARNMPQAERAPRMERPFCEACGKSIFPTRASAEKWIARIHEREPMWYALYVYECPDRTPGYRGYHLTRRPQY